MLDQADRSDRRVKAASERCQHAAGLPSLRQVAARLVARF